MYGSVPGADRYYLMIKAASNARMAHVRISELGKRGAVTKRITLIVGTGTKEMGKVPYAKAVHSVKVAVVSSLRAQARRGAPTGCAAPRMTADGL